MRAGGMQAEDTRMHLADGTLVKTPSAPCHRDDPSPACAGVPPIAPKGVFLHLAPMPPRVPACRRKDVEIPPLSLARRHRHRQSQP